MGLQETEAERELRLTTSLYAKVADCSSIAAGLMADGDIRWGLKHNDFGHLPNNTVHFRVPVPKNMMPRKPTKVRRKFEDYDDLCAGDSE